MTYDFDAATAVTQVASGEYRGHLDEGWGIWDTLNGGYVAAVGAKAMTAASGHPHPVSLTAHFIRPAAVGPVTIQTNLIAEGRQLSRVQATMTQGGKPIVSLLGSFGDVRHIRTRDLIQVLTDLPPPEECIVPDRSGEERATVAQRIETLMAPADAGFLEGNPSGNPQITAHIRLADERPIDPLALVFLADSLPPPAFNLDDHPAWLPTVALTVDIRQQPNPGWLRMRTTSPRHNYDRVTEHCEIYDNSGRMVANANQLAFVKEK